MEGIGERWKRFFGRSMLVFFLCLEMPLMAGAGEIAPADYLSLVLERNRDLAAARKSLESTYYAVRTSVAGQRPSMSLRGTASRLEGDVSSGRESERGKASLSLGLTHRFDVSGVYAPQERAAALNYEIQAATYNSRVNSTLADAERLYWQAVMAWHNVGLYEEILSQRIEDRRVTETRFQQDLIPRLDLIRSSVRVEDAKSLLVQARANYRDVLARMATQVGGEDVQPQRNILSIPELSVFADLDAAWKSRQDVEALNLSLEQVKLRRTLAAKGLSPILTGGVSWNVVSDTDGGIPAEDEVLLSLTLDVPLADGGLTKNETAQRSREIEASLLDLDALREVVTEELKIASNAWIRSVALEAGKREQVAQAGEELRITRLVYEQGLGAQIDLINAQVEQQQALTDHLSAIEDMYLALVQLKRAMGLYAPVLPANHDFGRTTE